MSERLARPSRQGVTVKLVELVALPAGVVTTIGPVVVPLRTTAVIFPSESTVKRRAFVPWNLTEVALVKRSPRIVTLVPPRPESGEKLEIFGGVGTV